MKYLKRFNEELNPQTYRKAARKLRKMGHEKRAKDIEDWADLSKWKENIEEYSKFGKFKLNILTEDGQRLNDDFFLCIQIDRDYFGDSIDGIKEDEEGEFLFFIGMIPTNRETIDKCEKTLPDSDLNNGFYWAMTLMLSFELKDSTIKFINYKLDNYDTGISGDVSFADRASAGRFKTLLKNMFSNKDYNYPSGYTDFDNFYDMIYNVFGAEYGLSSDYGFSPEVITDFINTISPNEMYKSI
jgi:hypothetical protein